MDSISPATENFLSTPACPFRRVSFGSANCTISTDRHISEVDPLTCHNCDIPSVIARPRCRFLSLGTELKPYRGEGKLVCAMACRALNIKLYSLKTCGECPLYSEVTALADVLQSKSTTAELKLTVSDSLIEAIAKDIKLDYGVRESEEPPLRPIRCWRYPEGHCRKFPVYTRRKVTVLLRRGEYNDELYRGAIEPALKSVNLIPYRLDIEMLSAEEMCRACENFQESDQVVINLDDWNVNSVFLAGIVYGLGSKTVLLKNDSLQPVPLLENMEHDVVTYTSVEELKTLLQDAMAPTSRIEGGEEL